MSAPVDVLAVLARHASLADQVACREQQAEAHAVFDAIAELIEASSAVLSHNPAHCDTDEEKRLRAALARVGGGK